MRFAACFTPPDSRLPRNESIAALVIRNRRGRSTSRRVQVRNRQNENATQVANTLVDIHIVTRRPRPAASAVDTSSAFRMAAMSLVRGASNSRGVDQRDLLVGDSSTRPPCAWPAEPPSSAADRTNRGAAWQRCDRRHDGYYFAASRPGHCPSPSADTSSSWHRGTSPRLLVLAEP